jgi:hypothetical protein
MECDDRGEAEAAVVTGEPPSTRAGLEALLIGLFEAPGLRRWLVLGPQGEALDADLPVASLPMREFVHAAAGALLRRGLVDGALFDRLAAEFPIRRHEIHQVRDGWIAARPSASVPDHALMRAMGGPWCATRAGRGDLAHSAAVRRALSGVFEALFAADIAALHRDACGFCPELRAAVVPPVSIAPAEYFEHLTAVLLARFADPGPVFRWLAGYGGAGGQAARRCEAAVGLCLAVLASVDIAHSDAREGISRVLEAHLRPARAACVGLLRVGITAEDALLAGLLAITERASTDWQHRLERVAEDLGVPGWADGAARSGGSARAAAGWSAGAAEEPLHALRIVLRTHPDGGWEVGAIDTTAPMCRGAVFPGQQTPLRVRGELDLMRLLRQAVGCLDPRSIRHRGELLLHLEVGAQYIAGQAFRGWRADPAKELHRAFFGVAFWPSDETIGIPAYGRVHAGRFDRPGRPGANTLLIRDIDGLTALDDAAGDRVAVLCTGPAGDADGSAAVVGRHQDLTLTVMQPDADADALLGRLFAGGDQATLRQIFAALAGQPRTTILWTDPGYYAPLARDFG